MVRVIRYTLQHECDRCKMAGPLVQTAKDPGDRIPTGWARFRVRLGEDMEVEPFDLCPGCTRLVFEFCRLGGPREWTPA